MAFRMLVCSGCCCATEVKLQKFDLAGQFIDMTHIVSARTVKCFNECSQMNVVVM